MSTRAVSHLSDEDRVLWNLVARTAKPLPGKKPLAELVASAVPPAGPEFPLVRPPAPVARRAKHVSHSLDGPSLEKLAKGRLQIEGRVDLHGLTQGEAHQLLLGFLQRAHASGVRYALIITGKGAGGEGVLRRQVPAWLSTPPFRALVSSYDHAARVHGGDGALYVRLRRSAQHER
jgi:DNA-nicking Smr family endonuclease